MRKSSAFASFRFVPLIVFVLASGCKTPPPPPNAESSGAFELGARALQGELDCPKENCIHWFRTQVPERGDLAITVREIGAGEDPAGYKVALSRGESALITNQSNMGRPELRIERELEPATYFVAVQSNRPGRRFTYTIQASFKAAPPPPPPPKPVAREPKYEILTSAILEAEGWGQDVNAVLIGLGQAYGLERGQRGRLLNQDEEIEFVIVDKVFPEGSRLEVDGPLSAPITPETVAEILIPVDQ